MLSVSVIRDVCPFRDKCMKRDWLREYLIQPMIIAIISDWNTWEQDCLRIRLMNNFTLDADAKDESYIGERPVCCSSDQESLK